MKTHPRIAMPTARVMAFLLAGTLLSTNMSQAQLDRSKPPKPGPMPETRIAKHETMVLENGMRVILVHDPKPAMVTLHLKIDMEPVQQGDIAGYVELAGELIAHGAKRRTKATIDELVDGMGGQLVTMPDGIVARGPRKRINDLMSLVFDLATSATFPADEFEKARSRALAAMEQREEDPEAIADQVLRHLSFGPAHPYGEIATKETIGRIERKHVHGHYLRHFRPDKAFLVVVGNINQRELFIFMGQYFAHWKVGPQQERAMAEAARSTGTNTGRQDYDPPTKRRVAIVDRPWAEQSVLRMGYKLHLHQWDPQAIHAQVLNTILGGSLFQARLMRNLREDKGLTYGVTSQLRPDKYMGSFNIGMDVRTAVTHRAVEQIRLELDKIRQEPVSKEELSVAKSHLAGNFMRSLEDPRTQAQLVLNTYLLNLPADHYDTYLQRLDTVTVQGVLAAAQRFILPEVATLVLVGDKQTLDVRMLPLLDNLGMEHLDSHGRPWKEPLVPVKDMDGPAVIEAFVKASGGEAALGAVRDLHILARGTHEGEPVVMELWKAQHGKRAYELRAGSLVLDGEVYDGMRGIRYGPDGTNEVRDDALQHMALEAHMFPEMAYASNAKVMLLGSVELDGIPCYKVLVALDDGSTIQEYFDMGTGLKYRSVGSRFTEYGNVPVVTTYKDHRQVEGVMFPHLIERTFLGLTTLTVNEVKVNRGVDPMRFRIDHEE